MKNNIAWPHLWRYCISVNIHDGGQHVTYDRNISRTTQYKRKCKRLLYMIFKDLSNKAIKIPVANTLEGCYDKRSDCSLRDLGNVVYFLFVRWTFLLRSCPSRLISWWGFTQGVSTQKRLPPPADLTVSKRPGTSNKIEIRFTVLNYFYLWFSFMKLTETL